MITKALVKTLIHRECPHLVQMMMNEDTLLKFYQKLLDAKINPQEFVEELDEDDSDSALELSPYEYFRTVPLALSEALIKYKQIYESDIISQFINDNEDLQEISRLSRRFFALMYKNVRRCDTVDGSLDGEEISDQNQIEFNTKKYMNDPSVKVILEGQGTVDGLRARYDVLIREGNEFVLVEVKGSGRVLVDPSKEFQSLKPNFLYDIGFQYEVYKRMRWPLKRLSFLHINPIFQRQVERYELTDQEVLNFFEFTDSIQENDELIPIKQYLDQKHYLVNSKGAPTSNRDIDDVIDELLVIQASNKVIEPKCHYACRKDKGCCPLLKECFANITPNHLLRLTCYAVAGGHFAKSKSLIEEMGVLDMKDIPDNFVEEKYPLKKEKGKGEDKTFVRNVARNQIDFAKGKLKHQHIIEPHGLEMLLKRDYYGKTLVFFDFESYQYAIPLTKPCYPWRQICCQYSMHVVKPDYDLRKHDFESGIGGGIRHYEFLGDPLVDKFVSPDKALIKTLKEQLVDGGIDYHDKNYCVIVYNKNFEQTRLKEMADRYSDIEDYKEFCLTFCDRVVDLLDFFTFGYWYHKDFGPSLSLKTTQPVLYRDPKILNWYSDCPFDLAKTLNYHDGLIQNGGVALSVYQTLLRTTQQGKMDKYKIPYEDLRKGLLAYCKIDSWGTVILYDTIVKAVNKIKDGTIDLDFDIKDSVL